jgi:SAM-dependent MidA family methyltransferase
MQGDLDMNAGPFEQMSDCWLSEEKSATYYRTAAAQARRLQADATTPRVKQYFAKMIAHCEGLARKVQTEAGKSLLNPSGQ